MEVKNELGNIKGIVLDMDGLMLDTEKIYLKYWLIAAKYYGYDMKKEHMLAIRSLAAPFAYMKFKEFFGEDCDYYAIRNKRREMMKEYFDNNKIEMKYGLVELLKYLKSRPYKVAVATASDMERTKGYLESLDLYNYFDKIICGDMVKSGKPMPDIYLEAAKRLGLMPSECIALEDSPNGVLSAYRAGCRVIMVPDLDEPDEETKKMLYRRVDNLEKVIDVLEERIC